MLLDSLFVSCYDSHLSTVSLKLDISCYLQNKSVGLLLPAKEKFAASNGIQLHPWQSAFMLYLMSYQSMQHNRF